MSSKEESIVKPLLREIPLAVNDVVLMTTDGLTKLLFDEEIKEILEETEDEFEESANYLLRATFHPNKVPNYIHDKKSKLFFKAVEDLILKDSVTILTIRMEEE